MSIPIDRDYAKLARLVNHRIPPVEIVEILIDSGFDVNYAVPPDNHKTRWIGCTALHLLVEKEYASYCIKIIKQLCGYGARYLKKNNEGFTPLRLAYEVHKDTTNQLSLENRKLIDALLEIQVKYQNAANPSCSKGISHFHLACLAGNSKVVKFFLDKNVPIDEAIDADSKIFPGFTGLHLAIYSENENVVQLLLQHGADRTRLNARSLSPIHLIVEKQLFDASFMAKYKPSEYKVQRNDYVLAEMSKSTAAEPNPVDSVGLSHLHIFCTRRYNFDLDNWTKLLAAGVDLNAAVYLDSPVWPGYTQAHFAARCNLDTMIWLLENGANPFAKDVNGSTPIDFCFDGCKPNDVSRIFNACSALRSIELRNKSKLSDAFAAFETTEKLRDYLKSTDVGTATIPLDSPLWPGWTLLHICVKLSNKDDGSKIQTCLKTGVSLTTQDANEMTALHMAYYLNKKNCVEELLKTHNTISANPVDKNGLSHFHIACIVGNDIVQKFLSRNVNPNEALKMDTRLYRDFLDSRQKDHLLIRAGSTPLHIAAVTSSPTLAKLLLKKKVIDPYRLDADGFTWIQRLLPHCYLFDELLSLPKVLRSIPAAPGGLSHLHVACCAYNKKAVEALLPRTTNVNEPIDDESMRRLGECKNATCLDTPLHLAVRARFDHSVEIIELLLENGADVGAKNADGLNPLHLALLGYKDRYGETKDVIKRLALEYSEKKMFPDEIGLTKLHVACLMQDVSMIQESLRSGESANCRMKMDSPLWPAEAPLYLLVKNGYPKEDDAVKIMLRHIVQELEEAISGDQPLYEYHKRQKKSLSLSRKLVVNTEGLSALHISCMGSDVRIVENFKKLGIDFYVPKDFFASEDAGFYPLHFAVKYGSSDVAEFLLGYKINIYCQDSCGNTPIHLAAASYDCKLEVFERTKEYNGGTQRNMYNKTVIDLLLNQHPKDWKKNIQVKMQFIATLSQKFTAEIFESLIKKISNARDVDADGRNVIHHIINHCPTDQNFTMLCRNILFLVNSGYKVDLKDKEGKTALHYAAHTGKTTAIAVLLYCGADINTTDNSGKVPLEGYDDSRPLNYETNPLLIYATKLEAAGLYVHEAYKKHIKKDGNNYSQDLNEMKQHFITKSITLRDVLSQKMVMRFPIMPKVQQHAITNYLKSKEKFREWHVVFSYQIRKAWKRAQWYNVSFKCLRQLLDPRLPDHCVDSILIHLSIEDWQKIIVSVTIRQQS